MVGGRGRPGARRARCPTPSRVRARTRPTGSRWSLADALRRRATLPGPPPTALVANLPYNVSVPVLLHLLDAAAVARARPGHGAGRGRRPARRRARARRTYGVPSVKAAWYADVRRAGAVGRTVFWPAPNVDSGLVAWTRREPPATTATREQVFAVVDAAFAQRRKTLRGRAGRLGRLGRRPPRRPCAAAGVDPRARGEQLDVDGLRAAIAERAWAALASAHDRSSPRRPR